MNILPTTLSHIRRPEINRPVRTGVFKLNNEHIVRRTYFDSGNTVDTPMNGEGYEPIPKQKPEADGVVELQVRK
jgi:hypothetical protein